MVIKDQRKVNLKDLPALANIGVERKGNHEFRLFASGFGEIKYRKIAQGDGCEASFLLDNVEVIDQGDKVGTWISGVVKESIRLVALPAPFRRNLGAPALKKAHDKLQNSFVDVSPVMIVNQATLDDLNSRISEPVSVQRFRPNIVIEGLDAFEEDKISSIASQDIKFDHVSACERCTIVNVDHRSGITSSKDPLNMLSQYRRISDGYDSGIVFGNYFNTLGEGTLRVGDVLRIDFRENK